MIRWRYEVKRWRGSEWVEIEEEPAGIDSMKRAVPGGRFSSAASRIRM
jgi:hypothetical protein